MSGDQKKLVLVQRNAEDDRQRLQLSPLSAVSEILSTDVDDNLDASPLSSELRVDDNDDKNVMDVTPQSKDSDNKLPQPGMFCFAVWLLYLW